MAGQRGREREVGSLELSVRGKHLPLWDAMLCSQLEILQRFIHFDSHRLSDQFPAPHLSMNVRINSHTRNLHSMPAVLPAPTRCMYANDCTHLVWQNKGQSAMLRPLPNPPFYNPRSSLVVPHQHPQFVGLLKASLQGSLTEICAHEKESVAELIQA